MITRVRAASSGAKNVDHITPISTKWEVMSWITLQVLCSSCHKVKTRREVTGHILGRVAWLDRLDEVNDGCSSRGHG